MLIVFGLALQMNLEYFAIDSQVYDLVTLLNNIQMTLMLRTKILQIQLK